MWGNRLLCLCVFGLSFSLEQARATLIISDDFSYRDGPLVTVSDGRWKTHSGTAAQALVAAGKLCLSQKKSEDVHVLFPGGAFGPIQAAALYATFKINFSTLPTGPDGTYFAHFKDATATTGLRGRVFASTNGASPGKFRVGIAAGTDTAVAFLPTPLALQTSYRLVCRLRLADNESTLWLNPLQETAPNITSTDEVAAKPAAAFAFRQSLSGGNGMGELTVDDLIVATTFSDLQLGQWPVITGAPADQEAAAGSTVSFRVHASGTGPLAYRWFHDGLEIPGAVGPVLELRGIALADAGTYQAEVSNRVGSVQSAAATLTVTPAPLIVGLAQVGPGTVQLRWVADPDQTYSVWVAEEAAAPFTPLVSDLNFSDGLGVFEQPISGPARFYRIGSP